MKILITADLHLAGTSRDAYRFVFLQRTLPKLLRTHSPDLLLILGDLTESDVALLVAVPVIVGSLGRIPVGSLTDRFGGRAMFPLVSAATIVRGAGRRGATVGGTAVLLIGAAIVVGLLALIPVVGYIEAVVIPALAARRARRGPEKYAGLRSLAK